VLAGEGGAGGDEVGGCALEDGPAAVVAGAGPRWMIQSACAMTAWWCSMTMTDLPESTSRSSRPSSCSTSAGAAFARFMARVVDEDVHS
jgi:hypothetical protein